MSHAIGGSLAEPNDIRLGRKHWKIVFTAGMGFFTDAYDLFIIGVVSVLLQSTWHISVSQHALLNGASLAAAAIGAVVFGILADKFGRKKLYGIEVFILFGGALLSAFSPNFTCLFISRVLVGLGIGADYPMSAVVTSEHAMHQRRGFIVLLVFAMQALGLIIGPFIAAMLLSAHLPTDLVWRLLLGFGAIPAASVFYLRRRIAETPHYLRTKQTPIEVSRVVADLAGVDDGAMSYHLEHRLKSAKWLKCLVGTAGAWFLLDVAFYGNGISSIMIMRALNPHADLVTHILTSAIIFLVCAAPGYFFAANYVDRIGRKFLQFLGFAVMAITYGLIAFVPHVTQSLPLFLVIFGIGFFFINFGPNTTTFLIPSEVYPTVIRARAHGISSAVGKLGAFIGAFSLPILLKAYDLPVTMGLMAIVSLAGILVTFLIPEMKKKPLEVTDA